MSMTRASLNRESDLVFRVVAHAEIDTVKRDVNQSRSLSGAVHVVGGETRDEIWEGILLLIQ